MTLKHPEAVATCEGKQQNAKVDRAYDAATVVGKKNAPLPAMM